MTIDHKTRSAIASFPVSCAHRAGAAGIDDRTMARIIFGGMLVALALVAVVLGPPSDLDYQLLSP